MAEDLAQGRHAAAGEAGAEAEGRRIGIAGLLFKLRPVDGATVEARRSACFQTALAQAEPLQRFAEQDAGGFTAATGGILLLAAVDEAVEEGARSDNRSSSKHRSAIAQFQTAHSRAGFDHQVHHLGLLDREVWLALQHLAHLDAVEGLIALGARRPDGRPARGIEQAELDTGGVRHLAHDTAERVHLAHQMAFGDAADGWVAAHLSNQV